MNKYHNKKVVIDGFDFDSKKEGERFRVLKNRLDNKEIELLVIHPTFFLQNKFVREKKTYRAITYESDFRYFDKELGKWIIEDVKGMKTEVYKIKKKLFIKNLPSDFIFVEI